MGIISFFVDWLRDPFGRKRRIANTWQSAWKPGTDDDDLELSYAELDIDSEAQAQSEGFDPSNRSIGAWSVKHWVDQTYFRPRTFEAPYASSLTTFASHQEISLEDAPDWSDAVPSLGFFGDCFGTVKSSELPPPKYESVCLFDDGAAAKSLGQFFGNQRLKQPTANTPAPTSVFAKVGNSLEVMTMTVRQWQSRAFANRVTAANGSAKAIHTVARQTTLDLMPATLLLGSLAGSKVADLRQVPIVTDHRLPSSQRVRIPNRESRGSDSSLVPKADLVAAGVYDAQSFTSSFGWD